VSVGLGAEGTHHLMTSSTVSLIFFDSILLIFRRIELAEPYKVRLDINLGVPDETMFTQPLSGPGC